MKHDAMICPHCSRKPMGVRVSSTNGIVFHWEGDYFFIDVVLICMNAHFVLYRLALVAMHEGVKA